MESPPRGVPATQRGVIWRVVEQRQVDRAEIWTEWLRRVAVARPVLTIHKGDSRLEVGSFMNSADLRVHCGRRAVERIRARAIRPRARQATANPRNL